MRQSQSTTEITRYQQLPPQVIEYWAEHGYDFKPGDTFIYEDGIVRITRIEIDNKREDNDDYKYKVYYQRAANYEATEWTKEDNVTVNNFTYYHRGATKLEPGKTVAEYWQEAKDIMEGKTDLSTYQDNQIDESFNENTALIHRTSKEGLKVLQAGMEQKRSKAELMKKFVGYEMERRRREMAVFMDQLGVIVAEFEKKIQKIMRVITTIELYLGINEELFQIQEGPLAPADTPITFRQKVLYMDEEIGHWGGGGLDWTNIEWFDEWLTVPENLQQVFPEPKGLVVFRPRRKDKDYRTDDWQYSAQMNRENAFRTYILIRNGDNIYRVYTDNIIILPRLFPLRKELQALMDTVQKEMNEAEGWSNEDERKAKSQDKIDDALYQYKKRAILMQGLIDRTEVFHPLPAEKINIFKLDELGDKVRFIYDDEEALPSGRKSFHDWWTELDEKIDHGSRILITGNYSGYHRDDYADRYYLAASAGGLKNVPDKPKAGVYQVERFRSSWAKQYRETEYREKLKELEGSGKKFIDEGEVKGKTWRQADKNTGSKTIYSIRKFEDDEELTILYKPDAVVYGGWGSYESNDRKVRARFKIRKDDDFLINYDLVTLEEVEFYLKSRVDRPNYLDMMPVLENMKKFLLKEQANEAEFVRFLAQRNAAKLGMTEEEAAARVREAISWWKFKNKIKRAITKDDALALKMIEKRINSSNYKSLV